MVAHNRNRSNNFASKCFVTLDFLIGFGLLGLLLLFLTPNGFSQAARRDSREQSTTLMGTPEEEEYDQEFNYQQESLAFNIAAFSHGSTGQIF